MIVKVKNHYTRGNEMTPGTIFFKSERAEQGHGTFVNERDNQAQNYGSRSGSWKSESGYRSKVLKTPEVVL